VSELRELMLNAQKPPQFVRYRVWHDHGLAEAARGANGPEVVGVHRIGPRPEDLPNSEIIISIWRSAGRLRVEHKGGVNDGAYGVGVGERWWSWSPRGGGARSSDQLPLDAAWIGKGADGFLDPAGLHNALRFRPIGHGTRVGRPVLVAEAWARPEVSGPTVIGANADRYRVEVDAETGLVLSVHAFIAVHAYQTIDVIDLDNDCPLNLELFEFQEPPGAAAA
jgi:hypothetical protein